MIENWMAAVTASGLCLADKRLLGLVPKVSPIKPMPKPSLKPDIT